MKAGVPSDPMTEYLEGALKRNRVPGLSAAVVHRDQVVWTGGAGAAELVSKTPMTPRHVCNWFSMTKIATATAAMQLADEGSLDLDAPVQLYAPVFASISPDGAVRVRHLLNHSSGLANPPPIRWVHPAGQPGPDQETFFEQKLARHSKLKFPPGSRAAYTNLGYLALGQVIAGASGRSFTDQVRRRILEPLNMQDTDFEFSESMAERAATAYQRLLRGLTPLLRALLPRGIVDKRVGHYVALHRFCLDGAAYGGLIGSVRDAARLVAAHVNGGVVDGVRVLSAEAVTRMQQITLRGRPFDLGLGWFRRHGTGPETGQVEHLGGGAGFFNVLRIYPERSIGVAVMGNTTKYDVEGVAEGLASLVA